MMVLLVRCAVWFEITHPEEDYWHRSAMRRDGPEKVSWLKRAGDLEDAQYQSCSQEEVDGQKIPVSVKIEIITTPATECDMILEEMIKDMDSLEDFEKKYPFEFLANDDHVGNYLDHLLWFRPGRNSPCRQARKHRALQGKICGVQVETIDDPFMKKITAIGENYEKTNSKGASQGCKKI